MFFSFCWARHVESILRVRWGIPQACLTLICQQPMAWIAASSKACGSVCCAIYTSQGEAAASHLCLPLGWILTSPHQTWHIQGEGEQLYCFRSETSLRPNYTYRVFGRARGQATSIGRVSDYIYTSKDETSLVEVHEKKRKWYAHSPAIPLVWLITLAEQESEWLSGEVFQFGWENRTWFYSLTQPKSLARH